METWGPKRSSMEGDGWDSIPDVTGQASRASSPSHASFFFSPHAQRPANNQLPPPTRCADAKNEASAASEG
jgi:hypothetical protein